MNLKSISIATIAALLALVLVLFGFHEQVGTIAPSLIWLLIAAVAISVFGIYQFGKVATKGERVMNGIMAGIAVLIMLNSMGVANTSQIPYNPPGGTLSVTDQQASQAAASGQLQSAILKVNAKADLGGTFATTAHTAYALKPGEVTDRYQLMKMAADGDTVALNGKAMTLTSGVWQYNGWSGKVGDPVKICSYTDNTPAVAENITQCTDMTLTGITGGSTPEWMVSQPTITVRTHATAAWKDNTDTSKVRFKDYEAAAVTGRHYKLYVRPTVLGTQFDDVILYVQASSANSSYITKIKATNAAGVSVETTALQDTGNMASNNPIFLAAPAINTTANLSADSNSKGGGLSTDKQYFALEIPNAGDAGVYTGSSHLGQIEIDVTGNHPAATALNNTFIFKIVSNGKALTSTGGHFEPATSQDSFILEMATDVGAAVADAWS